MLTLLALLACGDKPSDSGLDSEPPPVDEDGDGYFSDVDCDDSNPDIHPDADEYCDAQDTDCDGLTDDPDSVDATVWYLDGDSDGYGDETETYTSCTPIDLYVDVAGDCDDRDAGVNPGAQEICDGDDQDEDCDGLSDDADDSVDTSAGRLYYADADGDGYGDAEDAGTMYCDDGDGRVTEASDCDDGESSTNPGAEEVCGDGIDNDCDGTPTGCSPWGEESLGAHLQLDGSKSDELGVSVAVIGDVDGDGDADFAVGATQGASSNDGGEVAVFFDDLSAPHEYTWSTLRSDVGAAIAGGDWDGDGEIDLLVGGPNDDGGDGVVLLEEGPLDDGRTLSGGFGGGGAAGTAVAFVDLDGDNEATPVWGEPGNNRVGWWSGDEAYMTASGSTALGSSLGAVDLDSDGSQELVAADTSSGAVYWYAGDPDGADLGDGETVTAEAGTDELGFSIASGDLDGDGADDLVLGARGEGTGGSLAGAVYVLDSVGTKSVDKLAMATLTGQAAGDQAGSSVAVTDVDGDGDLDLAVGAPGSDLAVSGAGAVFLFYGPLTGSADLEDADAVLTGAAAAEEVGAAMAGGDVDGDGYGDLVIGAPGASGGGSLSGGVYLVLGDAW